MVREQLSIRCALLAAGSLAACGLAACGGAGPPAGAAHAAAAPTHARTFAATTAAAAPAAPAPPPPPHLAVRLPAHTGAGWSVVARVHGAPAAWVAQRGSVTLMRFDQRLVHLDLHAGSSDGGSEGWVYGDAISPREVHLLIAAVNGGFKLTYAETGFVSAGHVAAPLHSGVASIVTYTDGTTDIGMWHEGVPTATKRVFSVLQNQHLLVDRGVPAADVAGCVVSCWGETIGSRTSVARSALGVTAAGELVWAAGEELEPAPLAEALAAAGAVRAIELDINPDWVAGYLYVHGHEGPQPQQVVPGQLGIAGHFLEPYSRDFLAFVAN